MFETFYVPVLVNPVRLSLCSGVPSYQPPPVDSSSCCSPAKCLPCCRIEMLPKNPDELRCF